MTLSLRDWINGACAGYFCLTEGRLSAAHP